MTLELYYKPTCPFCQKVLRYMDDNGIKDIVLKDTSVESAYEQELIRVGGKGQVPCLFIDGKPMYESDDIIAFLKQEFK